MAEGYIEEVKLMLLTVLYLAHRAFSLGLLCAYEISARIHSPDVLVL